MATASSPPGGAWSGWQELAAELGENLLPVELDVTDADAVAGFVDSLPEDWRRIDVLVNNAGLALGLSPAWEADLADWDTMIATNISGLVHMTRAILPGMVERDDGVILNLGSVAGEYPYPGGHVYGGTKAFVRQFSLNLRADLVGRNIRVTDIEPGMVGGSEFSQVRFHGDEAKAAAVYAGITPLNPDDIAEDRILDRLPAEAHEHQQDRDDAHLPSQRAVCGKARLRTKNCRQAGTAMPV